MNGGASVKHDHEGILKRVRYDPPTDEVLTICRAYSSFFTLLERRYFSFIRVRDVCMCNSRAYGNDTPAISHQLKVLKDANLLIQVKERRFIILADDHVCKIIISGFEHLLRKK